MFKKYAETKNDYEQKSKWDSKWSEWPPWNCKPVQAHLFLLITVRVHKKEVIMKTGKILSLLTYSNRQIQHIYHKLDHKFTLDIHNVIANDVYLYLCFPDKKNWVFVSCWWWQRGTQWRNSFLDQLIILHLASCLRLKRIFCEHTHSRILTHWKMLRTNNHLGNLQIIQIHYGSMGKQTFGMGL